jgi:hypothetical protein
VGVRLVEEDELVALLERVVDLQDVRLRPELVDGVRRAVVRAAHLLVLDAQRGQHAPNTLEGCPHAELSRRKSWMAMRVT